jgi:hypothetical protein
MDKDVVPGIPHEHIVVFTRPRGKNVPHDHETAKSSAFSGATDNPHD